MFSSPLSAPAGSTAEFTDATGFYRWQYELILYSLVVAGLALFASGIYNLATRSEISKQYRAASLASALITFVAALAYLALILTWLIKWTPNAAGTMYFPKPGTVFTGLRFADWSVTVPLLCVELFAVCNLAKQRATYTRFAAMACAFLMIITGFFGVEAVGQNNASNTELIVWGLISTAFFIALYPLLLGAVKQTRPHISDAAGISLRNAVILLLSVFGVYPVVYLIFLWADRGNTGWAVTAQLAFSFADIAAKAGFGALIHKVAKLRTAEDAAHEDALVPDTFPAAVSINGVSLSTPGHPYRANGLDGTDGHANIARPGPIDGARNTGDAAGAQADTGDGATSVIVADDDDDPRRF